VGKSKAEVAAAAIARRIPGVTVTPHHGMIQDKTLDFYDQFHVIVLGLDSLEARRHMNAVACSFLRRDDAGAPDLATVKPLIDGGTEGFKGHARVLIPGVTPCFECTLWLFPPQTKFPLCTLAETPRSPAHCIEYAKIVLWPRDRPDEEFDADNEVRRRDCAGPGRRPLRARAQGARGAVGRVGAPRPRRASRRAATASPACSAPPRRRSTCAGCSPTRRPAPPSTASWASPTSSPRAW
jgi:hypothetical protein